jgi:hypothetical protein
MPDILSLKGTGLTSIPYDAILDGNYTAVDLSDNPDIDPLEITNLQDLSVNYGIHFNLQNTPFQDYDFGDDYYTTFKMLRRDEILRSQLRNKYTPSSTLSSLVDLQKKCDGNVDTFLAELSGESVFIYTEPKGDGSFDRVKFCFTSHELQMYISPKNGRILNPYTNRYFSETETENAKKFIDSNPSRIPSSRAYLTKEKFLRKLTRNTTVFIDLDHTLINSSLIKSTTTNEYFENGEYYTYIRPYAIEFLKFVFERCKRIVIWSAGTKGYVERIRDELCKRADIPRASIIAIYRELFNTTNKNVLRWIEEYDLVGMISPKDVLFIDDVPENIFGIPYNKIYRITPFNLHHTRDTELRLF